MWSPSLTTMTTMERDDPKAIARKLRQDLDGVRVQMERSREMTKGGSIAIRALALSEQVECLCREAVLCRDNHQSNELLANARAELDKLKKLLGSH